MTEHHDDWAHQRRPKRGDTDRVQLTGGLARRITKPPGMYLGSASFERAVGFVHGLEHQLLRSCRTQEDFSTLPTSEHRDLLQRDGELEEHVAIRRLEPLLVELFTTILKNEL